MPQGPGTYGRKVGRPPLKTKKRKKAKPVRRKRMSRKK